MRDFALDVYEEKGQIFFEDRSNLIISDDVFIALILHDGRAQSGSNKHT